MNLMVVTGSEINLNEPVTTIRDMLKKFLWNHVLTMSVHFTFVVLALHVLL